MSEAVIVSFYTPEWQYKSRAQQMMRDCDRLNLPHDIRPRASLNNWNRNTAMKPRFIQEVMQDHQHIIWLDCDGQLLARPELCLSQPEWINIQACKHQSMRNHPVSPREWHTGMLSIINNRLSRVFVELWGQCCDQLSITDELAFHRMAFSYAGTIQELPPHYHRTMMRGVDMTGAIYGMGVSQSPDKMAMKKRQRGNDHD